LPCRPGGRDVAGIEATKRRISGAADLVPAVDRIGDNTFAGAQRSYPFPFTGGYRRGWEPYMTTRFKPELSTATAARDTAGILALRHEGRLVPGARCNAIARAAGHVGITAGTVAGAAG
jgi:hypothetical protein